MIYPVRQPLKISAAVFLVVLGLLFTYVFFREDAAGIGSSGSGVSYSGSWPASVGHASYGALIVDSKGLVKDAHRLPAADSFLPHFKAVTEMEGMTMDEAKSGCTWLYPAAVTFTFDGSDADWKLNDRSDMELDRQRNKWHEFIESQLLPFEEYKERFDGRGIIIVAGNEKSLKRVRVILRQLMKLKSELPIEIHFWGQELNESSRNALQELWQPNKMFFNDLSDPANIAKTKFNPYLINYQLKTAAIINSRFAEPFLLDSDNIPIIDPAELYDSATYREFGTLFWPDIARTRTNNPMWPITNTKCRMDEYEQESGQLLVDKRRFFYHLQLADWFGNAQPDQYYSKFLLGDKDLFRFSWHALKTPFGSPARWLTSVGTLTPDGYYCGHTFAQYHPDRDDGRIAFLHGGLLKTLSKELISWHRETNGGIFKAYKKHPHDENLSVTTNVSIKWDIAEYLPNKPEGMPVASCTDFYDVEPKMLEEILPGFEKRYEEIGGYWMLDA